MRSFHYIFHILAYNVAWIMCMLIAAHGDAWTSAFVVLMFVSGQYFWQYYISNQNKNLNYLVILLTIVGTCIDTLLLHLGLVTFAANPFSPYISPPWMIAIWISFSVTLYSIFSDLFKRLGLLALLSFLGFSLAYAIGAKMGAAFFPKGYLTALLIGLIWMLLLPGSLFFYNRTKGI